MNFDLPTLINTIGVIVNLVLLVLVLVKRGLKAEVARGLFFLLLIYFLVPAGRFLEIYQVNWLTYTPDDLIKYWMIYGIFAGSILVRNISAGLARRVVRFLPWNLVGLLWFLYVLVINFFSLPSGLAIDQSTLIFWSLLIGWGFFMLFTIHLLNRSYRLLTYPPLRNRIVIWGISLIVLLAGNILWIFQRYSIGLVVNLVALVGMVYVVLTPRLPHLGITFRRMLNSVIIVALEILVYGLVFLGVKFFFLELFPLRAWAAAAVLALIILILINPALKRIQAWMDHFFFGEEQDVQRILREFSQSISNILDMELLSAVVVELVQNLLGVDRGTLFVVELELGTNGEKQYRIKKGRRRSGSSQIGTLPSKSPLVEAWGQEKRALTQAEIDMLPRYQSLRSDTRRWINHLEMDVFVPIHAQDEWVGLLILGPKSSGASFYAEDIDLLNTLADQMSVALQNTRLVESLMRVNTEFGRAYSAMEEAHSKLQRIDRTKSDFISITSHELRTPLTILSGYSQMLLDAPDIKDNPIYSDAVQGLYDGSKRLHEIVDSMLDVAKIDMQDLALQASDVKLEVVLQRVTQDFAKTCRERKLTLVMDKNLNKLPDVKGDPEALLKVFRHILSNAVKYTPDKGTITISGQEVPPGSSKFSKAGVEIMIQDTGIGIDPRFKELVFTKFYQTGDVSLHSSGRTKFKGGGPGLGLAIVRGIVEAHSGRVWAESPGYDEEKCPGSTFHVILPMSTEQLSANPD